MKALRVSVNGMLKTDTKYTEKYNTVCSCVLKESVWDTDTLFTSKKPVYRLIAYGKLADRLKLFDKGAKLSIKGKILNNIPEFKEVYVTDIDVWNPNYV